MGDVGELAVRMVVSLTVVLGVVAAAYGIARRRQLRSPRPGSTSRMSTMRRKPKAPAPSLDVEARTGLARGSSAVAVRFADRIVLIGVTDGASSTVLAEIPAEEWDRPPESPSDTDSTIESASGTSSPQRTPFDPNGVVSERPSFIEALRDATSRRP